MRYVSLVLDVDSTLCGVEGIDWLARRRGKSVAEQCVRLTDRAMSGAIPLESVYGERLAAIQPSLNEVNELANEYRRTLAPGVQAALHTMRAAKVGIRLISGGIRQAIEPVALELGFTRDQLHAVDLTWDADGRYTGFDSESPLTRQRGKLDVVRSLALEPPSLAVGDGSTDVVMREATDAFAAFTGFAQRVSVIEHADFVVRTYEELARKVIAG